MKFVAILKAVYREYGVDFCYVADHIGIDDEVVKNWEKEASYPNEEELKKFSDLFAIPYSALKKSIHE